MAIPTTNHPATTSTSSMYISIILGYKLHS